MINARKKTVRRPKSRRSPGSGPPIAGRAVRALRDTGEGGRLLISLEKRLKMMYN